MPRHDSIYWQLIYPDGEELTEPPDGGSIKDAWAGAVGLRVMNSNDDRVVFAVGIADGYRPIFYRKRSLSVSPATNQISLNIGGGITIPGKLKADSAKLNATVFGRGKTDVIEQGDETGQIKFNGTLYALVGGVIIDCPEWLIAQTAIFEQLTVPLAPRKSILVM